MLCFMVVGDAALKKRVKNRGVTEHRTCYFLYYFSLLLLLLSTDVFLPFPMFIPFVTAISFRHFVMTIFPIVLSHFYADTFCLVYLRNLNFKAPFVKFVVSRIAHHFVSDILTSSQTFSRFSDELSIQALNAVQM